MQKTLFSFAAVAALLLSAASSGAHTFANGLATNGLTQNGLATNGLTQNGLATNGLTQNGLTQNGLTQNGINPNGLSYNGVALKGTERVVVANGDALVDGIVLGHAR